MRILRGSNFPARRAPARRCQTPECRLLCSAQLASVHSETPCPPSPSEARVSKRPPCTSAREAFPARRGREGSVSWCGTVRVSQFPEKYQIEGRTKETGQRSALTSTKREVVRRTFTVVAEVLFARHRHVVRIGEIFHRRPLPRLRDPMGVRGGNDALQGLRGFALSRSQNLGPETLRRDVGNTTSRKIRRGIASVGGERAVDRILASRGNPLSHACSLESCALSLTDRSANFPEVDIRQSRSVRRSRSILLASLAS